jgi:hypothetical protein
VDQEAGLAYVKFVVAAVSMACVGLGLSLELHALGGAGYVTLGLSAAPLVLVGAALALGRPFGRVLAALALVAFLIVGMKTSGAKELEHLMTLAFGGLLVSAALLVRPERAEDGVRAMRPA